MSDDICITRGEYGARPHAEFLDHADQDLLLPGGLHVDHLLDPRAAGESERERQGQREREKERDRGGFFVPRRPHVNSLFGPRTAREIIDFTATLLRQRLERERRNVAHVQRN